VVQPGVCDEDDIGSRSGVDRGEDAGRAGRQHVLQATRALHGLPQASAARLGDGAEATARA